VVYGNVPIHWQELLEAPETGRWNLDPFITGIFPLVEAETAFRAIDEGTVIKAVVCPGA